MGEVWWKYKSGTSVSSNQFFFVRMQDSKELALFAEFMEFYTSRQVAEQRTDPTANVMVGNTGTVPSIPETPAADSEEAARGIVSGQE